MAWESVDLYVVNTLNLCVASIVRIADAYLLSAFFHADQNTYVDMKIFAPEIDKMMHVAGIKPMNENN